MTGLHSLPAHTLRLLHEADRALLSLVGESHYPLYHLLRVSCQQIAHVDSFYIGFFCPGEQAMMFPYTYDGTEYEEPEKVGYGPHGITAWVLQHRRAYWSAEDSGELMNRGRSFGDEERLSEETIVVPLARPNAARSEPLLGLLGVLSYQPNSYDQTTVAALSWLAGSAATALHREQEDRARLAALGSGMPAQPVCASPADILAHVSGVLQDLRRRIEQARALLPNGDPASGELASALHELVLACEQGQTDVSEWLLGSPLTRPDPLAALSEAERAVLPLLLEGRTHAEIAVALCLSPHTVKTHARHIRRKLGAADNAHLARIARPWLHRQAGS